MIYLDSSATLKLLVREAETAALGAWLDQHSEDGRVSSQLSIVEVLRACRRHRPALLPQARALLDSYDLVPLTASVITDAADLDGVLLSSLDALHLASALSVAEELTAFVAYDVRLVEAAVAADLPVVQPS